MWVVLGIVLVLPALRLQLALDDFFHVASLESRDDVATERWKLFAFVPEGEDGRKTSLRLGLLPWWASPHLKIAFFRPLSSALVAFDHAVFGRNPLGWHAHSLLWWAALLVAVALLFGKTLPAATGVLALALFALDDAHWMPIAWSAARNGLVATVPAFLGLHAHLLWRRDGWRAGAILAPVGFAVGLAGGEAALGALAYVVAYELVDGAGAPWSRRLKASTGLAVVLLGWGVARAAVGAGVSGSGAYVDPLSDPVGFALAAVGRVPALFGNLLWGIPADLWGAGAVARTVLVVVGVVGAVFVGFWQRSALHRLGPGEARPIRWLALGSALSLLPCVGAIPGERVLLPASVGAAALFAALLRDGVQRWREGRGRGLVRRLLVGAAMVTLALPNLVLAGPMLTGKILVWKSLEDKAREAACAASVDDRVSARDLLVWSDDAAFAQFGGGARWFYCPGRTKSWTILSLSPHAQTLSRVSPTTLLLDFTEPALDAQWEVLFRDRNAALRVGDTFTQAGGLTAIVERVAQGRPTRVRFELAEPIELGEFRPLVWRGGRLERLALPVGGTVSFGAETR